MCPNDPSTFPNRPSGEKRSVSIPRVRVESTTYHRKEVTGKMYGPK
jgi:hypothetical protein